MGSLRVRHDWAIHFHFSPSCIGERNGNPLQCSCLENPRDGRAWWAAVYGVTQSQTRLKWLSSSSRHYLPIPTTNAGWRLKTPLIYLLNPALVCLNLDHCVCVCVCGCVCKSLSRVQLFVTPWTATRQIPLSLGILQASIGSGLPCPPPGDLPNPGIEPRSPTLQVDSLPAELPGKPWSPCIFGSILWLESSSLHVVKMGPRWNCLSNTTEQKMSPRS